MRVMHGGDGTTRGSGLLLGGADLSDDQRRQLVRSLFSQPQSLVAYNFGAVIIAGVCWRHTGNAWFVAWAGANLAILALRLSLALAFRRREERLTPEGWTRLFLVGGVATAITAGLGTSLAVYRSEDLVAMLYMATNVISFAGGAVVRNTASPLAARAQTVIALGCPGIVCLASGVPYLQVFALLILFHLAAQFEIIASLGTRTKWLMAAQREQAELNAKLVQACEQLAAANDRLEHLSATDGLTGLANRRALDSALDVEWARACREQRPLALLMLDADHFKRFNDRHGHLAGDDALRAVARVLQARLRRPSDLAARFGGEEFAVFLPGTDLLGAIDVAEDIRQRVAELSLSGASPEHTGLTVSIGVAAVRPEHETKPVSLISLADSALYAAKSAGRDRVTASPGSVPAFVG